MFVKLRKHSSAFAGNSDGLSRNVHCTWHCCRFDQQQISDGRDVEALNSYQVKEGEDPCSIASEYELSNEGVSAPR